ncbi:DUF4263 domain-containing protein [Peribacillus simplex]|uniref:Shedu protein SduA C-terminal domain-containing protein n=1 Tax=Peribacillus simplex TaxID=1478 RepID=A0A9W4KWL0_9BACI|nr:DUF4263 domain-containing protein [Peribacillus simplex]CAH0185620.1 hypothetical protein SRABI133_01536 [Peribacillus simplex]
MNEILVNEKLIEKFVYEFYEEIKLTRNSLIEVGMDISSALPDAFNGDSVIVHATYSNDKQHVLIRFNKSKKFAFSSTEVIGDVFNLFDPYGTWKGKSTAVQISNSSGKFSNIKIIGMRPFEIVGNNIELAFEQLKISTPNYGEVFIPYGFVFSYNILLEKLKSLKQFVSDFTNVYWQYYKKQKPKDMFITELEIIKLKMEELFFDETVGELEIDNFIKNNPVILENCLGLKKQMHQVKLNDIHGINPKEFKPDLIAYSVDDKNWKIVDYKRAKRNIINNAGKERTHFKSEISSLEAQLDDYISYFDDHGQKENFKTKYGVLIEYPTAIGVIGNVSDEQNRDFNKLKQRLPNWLEIVPYNYLYDRFGRFIELANKLVQK